MKKDKESFAAGIALLAIIIFAYLALGYGGLKSLDTTLEGIDHPHFKTLEDILNGNP
jgi:hypothetical protein